MSFKRRFGTFLLIAGIFLLLGAAGLAGYNLWENHQADQASQSILREIPGPDPEKEEETVEETEGLPEGQKEYEKYPDMEMPRIKVNGRYYIGKLYFPELKLTVPVQADYEFSALRTAPCRYEGSVYTNDMVICGHNYRSHFGKLVWLNPGDKVVFYDIDGNRFSYVIGSVEILGALDGEDMVKDGDWDLTLFTCTFSGNTRRTLRCYLEK